MPAIVYVDAIDPMSSNVYMSPQVEAIVGYPPASFETDNTLWPRLIHPEDRERALADIELAQQAVGPFASEYRLIARDGRVVWVRDQSVVVRDADGVPRSLHGLIFDITHEKGLESQLQQAQKMEAVGQLAGGIAHDFNNLLTAITCYTDLLMEGHPPHDPDHEDLQQIRLAADRAAALTRQMLAFGRRQPLRPENLAVDGLVSDLEPMLRRLVGETIEIQVETEGGLGIVAADRSQLEQVLVNLAVNARDAMPDGGRLTIAIANAVVPANQQRPDVDLAPGSYVRLTVSDTGDGIDADILPRVFDPFFTTKERGRGTGMGLATVDGVVRQSGGAVTVDSRTGEGTTFQVLLPRVDELPAVPQPPASFESRGQRMVLVVEDEPAVRALIVQILQSHGYQVLEAGNGERALEIAAAYAGPIDLLLADVVMPGMRGSEVATRLATLRPTTAAIFVSGYPEDEIVRDGVLKPNVTFVQKPFTASELLQRVREVLDN
jgi:two-component system cell cycle sensor histidine kinase/response regulator CckA